MARIDSLIEAYSQARIVDAGLGGSTALAPSSALTQAVVELGAVLMGALLATLETSSLPSEKPVHLWKGRADKLS